MLSSTGRQPAVFIILGLVLGVHLLLALVGDGLHSVARAQGEPLIMHQGVDCLVTQKHAVIRAVVRPADEIRVVRIYFRSALYPEFYFVEATRNGDVFEAVIPKPKPETKRVIYYIEAVTHGFATSRTNNFDPDVTEDESECDDDALVPPYFPGSDPNIIIGITQAGVPAIPPGFQAVGLAGRNFPTTGVIVGAAAAGTAGVLIGTQGNDEGDNDGAVSPPSVPTTTTSAATTTTTSVPISPGEGSPLACFTTEPDPPRIMEGDVVQFRADCSKPSASGQGEITSYQWDFGDGASREGGRFVQRLYTEPGTYTVTLTVTNQAGMTDSVSRDVIVEEKPSTTTTTVAIPNSADISVNLSAAPNTPAVGQLTYTVTVTNIGPQSASGVQMTINFPGQITAINTFTSSVGVPACAPFGVPVTSCPYPLASMPAGSNWVLTFEVNANSGTFNTDVSVTSTTPADFNLGNNAISIATTQPLRRADSGEIATSLTSILEAPPPNGAVRAQVILNAARVDQTDNRAPYRHDFHGTVGANTIEAFITSGDPREGIWRFDFREAPHFVRSSIQIESGLVVSQGAQEVVFRVSGPRIVFRYRLER